MYKNKKVIHIVATGNEGEIGFNNNLLWHIPDDLRFFKETTLGHVVLMGRKTVESLPKPLQRRMVIPIGQTRNGCENLEDALGVASEFSNRMNTDCIYIAGGASIYEQTKDIVDEILLTQVHHDFNQADTFYQIPKGFKLIEDSEVKQYEDLYYSFTKWSK